MNFSTHNHKETLAIGERLGQCLKPGDIVLLFGDLGSGKTTLTQGLCHGLGISKSEYVRSPTFILINEYKGTFPIFHIDLYRLDSFSEIEALGLEELLFSNGVSIIEWAEKLFPKSNEIPSLGIDEHIKIHITIREENYRNFKIDLVNHKQRSLAL